MFTNLLSINNISNNGFKFIIFFNARTHIRKYRSLQTFHICETFYIDGFLFDFLF